MRTWEHSDSSVDQSVFLPAGDQAGRIAVIRGSGHASFATSAPPCFLLLALGNQISCHFYPVIDLHQFYGFEKTGVHELLGQIGKMRVYKTLDNSNAVLVKLDKKYLICFGCSLASITDMGDRRRSNYL